MSKTLHIEHLHIGEVIRKTRDLAAFAQACNMPEYLQVTEPSADSQDRLRPLKLSAKFHFCKPGEIKKKWHLEKAGMGFTVPDASLDGSWHIAIELTKKPNDVLLGVLLCQIGHYVEQVASGNGYKRGKFALRGTSFDAACRVLSKISGFSVDDPDLLASADEFIAQINGTWIAWATGTDPLHSAADLLVGGDQSYREPLTDVLRTKASQLGDALTKRAFYAANVESIGWENEKGMCLVMDSATTRLINSLQR